MSTFRYQCPHCNSFLSEENGALVEMAGWMHAPDFSVRSSFQLVSTPGQYGAIIADNIQLREGARVEFECPHEDCRHGFTSPYHDDMCALTLQVNDERFTVLFNKIYGKHATFKLDEAGEYLLEKFGAHASEYEDLFEDA